VFLRPGAEAGDPSTPVIACLVVVALVAIGTTNAQATPSRAAACPAPKPLPSGLKKPGPGATATQLASFLLALPQRQPCDLGLFTSQFQPGPWPGLYPKGPPMEPLPLTQPTEAGVRAQLAAFLAGSSARAPTLALFDRADVDAKLSDPTLRAALVALKGTVAAPAIDTFLRNPRGVRFGGLQIRMVGRAQAGSEIILNGRYRSEHFALLSAMLAHEILHHDPTTNFAEEIVLNAVTSIVHMQLLARRPELATSRTELSRYMNEWALLLANSRRPGSPRIALIAPSGRGVAPGSPENAPDLWTFITKRYTEAGSIRAGTSDAVPAPPALAAVLRKLVAPGVLVPAGVSYSRKTAQFFSRLNDTWLTPVDRVRLNVLLGLLSVDEIVAYTGLPRSKAVTAFRLAPVVAATS
jgi:hypothetical protein